MNGFLRSCERNNPFQSGAMPGRIRRDVTHYLSGRVPVWLHGHAASHEFIRLQQAGRPATAHPHMFNRGNSVHSDLPWQFDRLATLFR